MSFSLADALKSVSELDAGREQIQYIRRDLIDSDANNFYQLSDLDGLADNISLCGLQQPIRVRRNPDSPERYTIVSGHRRRAAIEMLAADDPEKWGEVPCIVEQDSVSPALQQLRLIFANSGTRKLTSAEISEQTVQVEKLLYQLKEEEGCEFPGRMRDYVAEVVGVSKSKIARLKMIREKLERRWLTAFNKNELKESSAYALSQLSDEYQKAIYDGLMAKNGHVRWIDEKAVKTYRTRFDGISELKCKVYPGGPCSNQASKRNQAVLTETYYGCPCNKCCKNCINLISCKNACPKLAKKIKELKADKREPRRKERQAQEEKDRPDIEQIQNLYLRYGYLREKSGKTVEEVYQAADMFYSKSDGEKITDLEVGRGKITTQTKLPYGYSCNLSDVRRIISMADLFGCSIDYMLCRTDYPELVKETLPEKVSDFDTGWKIGTPDHIGRYVVIVKFAKNKEGTPQKLDWSGEDWTIFGESVGIEASQILGWIPMPKEAE